MNKLMHDNALPRRSMGYLSAPISAPDALSRTCFRLKALETSARLWEEGILHYCPHANSPAVGSTDVSYETWMAMDLEVLRRCDWILMGVGWEASSGCRRELSFALYRGITPFKSMELAIAYTRQLDADLRTRTT